MQKSSFAAPRMRVGLVATVLFASSLIVVAPGSHEAAYAKDCSGSSVGFTPLNDLVGGFYNGEPGGLYPGNTNHRPNESTVRSVAEAIGPVDAHGNPDPNGDYGLLSIGMSNTKIEFNDFFWLSFDDPERDDQLTVVNGAHGGVDAQMWADPDGKWWGDAEKRVGGRGLTPEQIQVAWVKLAIGAPSADGWTETERLQGYLADVARIIKDRFPNVQIVYYSSRIYGGYATRGLNPEPYAYQGAFAVKWVIEDQLNGDPSLNFDRSKGPVEAPLLTWGAYLWADGLRPRSDGLTWECQDFIDDGTHPSELGSAQVAQLLLDHFKTDTTARLWYLENSGGDAGGGGAECTIHGTDGDDVLHGTEGDDVICGLDGSDTVYGGPGDDHLDGGNGADECRGGTGTNTVVNCESTRLSRGSS